MKPPLSSLEQSKAGAHGKKKVSVLTSRDRISHGVTPLSFHPLLHLSQLAFFIITVLQPPSGPHTRRQQQTPAKYKHLIPMYIAFHSGRECHDNKHIQRDPQQTIYIRSYAIIDNTTLLRTHRWEVYAYAEFEDAEGPEGECFGFEEHGEEERSAGDKNGQGKERGRGGAKLGEKEELADLEKGGGRGDERWLKRRLPSIMAAMKVAKMTPKGMWVSEGGELVKGMPEERALADFMAADQ